MRCATRVGELRIHISVRKPQRKKRLHIPQRKWEDNIKMGHKETVCESISWPRLDQDMFKLRAFCEHGNELSASTQE